MQVDSILGTFILASYKATEIDIAAKVSCLSTPYIPTVANVLSVQHEV